MQHPILQPIWPCDEPMALRPRLPRAMSMSPAELRDLMDRELSDQQKRVLLLLSEGHANKAIAWVLGVEEATAKAHVSAILKKFGCTNRTQAAFSGSVCDCALWTWRQPLLRTLPSPSPAVASPAAVPRDRGYERGPQARFGGLGARIWLIEGSQQTIGRG